jgi:hypothetical protein
MGIAEKAARYSQGWEWNTWVMILSWPADRIWQSGGGGKTRTVRAETETRVYKRAARTYLSFGVSCFANAKGEVSKDFTVIAMYLPECTVFTL